MLQLKQKFQDFIKEKANKRIVNTPNGKQRLSVLRANQSAYFGGIRPADFVVCHTDGTKRYPHAVFYTVPTSKIKETADSVRRFFKNYRFRNLEAFVFDYERKVWMSFKRSTNEGDRDDNYSYVLNSRLTDLVPGSGYCRTNYVVEKPVWENCIQKENYIGIGMASPLPQHYIASKAICDYLDSKKDNLTLRLNREFAVFGDVGLKKCGKGKRPDAFLTEVVDYNTSDMIPYIIVEVDHSYRMSATRKKLEEYMKLYKPTYKDSRNSHKRLLEYFAYDFDKNKWYSYGPNADPNRPSYSKLLNADLAEALK